MLVQASNFNCEVAANAKVGGYVAIWLIDDRTEIEPEEERFSRSFCWIHRISQMLGHIEAG